MRNFQLFFLIGLPICCYLWTQQQEVLIHPPRECSLSSKPLYEVATLGAPTAGALLEASVGSLHQGNRHRFYYRSSIPPSGFLGAQRAIKPSSLKDQPGVFPATLMGSASLTFTFSSQTSHSLMTPLLVKPDGTVCRGLPMTKDNSPQTLVISSPAQTGIYTLFVLAHENDPYHAVIQVNASISTRPEQEKIFHLNTFAPNNKNVGLTSAEFTYTLEN